MESFWQVAVGVAGLGAVGAFIFWSLYRGWLNLGIFAKLSRKQTFVLMVMFLLLTFAALVVVVIAYLKKDSGPVGKEEVASLKEMVLHVRRGGDDHSIDSLEVVRDGRVSGEQTLEPLGPRDDFKITGRFYRPQIWQLFWFDTRGKIQIVARSESASTSVDYPEGDQMVAVSEEDPLGVHLLLLTTGKLPHRSEEEVLHALAPAGRVPEGAPPPTVSRLRGPGQLQDTGVSLHSTYLHDIDHRLDDRLSSKLAVFLSTADAQEM